MCSNPLIPNELEDAKQLNFHIFLIINFIFLIQFSVLKSFSPSMTLGEGSYLDMSINTTLEMLVADEYILIHSYLIFMHPG
jgi:hypothetical protein